MKKSQVLGTVCALFLCFSVSTNAAIILPDSDFGGNIVNEFGSGPGFTDIEIEFLSMNPVWLHLDNGDSLTDDIVINFIGNNTGIPWTDFHFEFTGAEILQPIGIFPLTGTIIDIQGDPTTIWLFLDPPEVDGFIDGAGIIDTSLSPDYWLHIAPSAVPVPAAVWLFGSGLLGLVGMARRKKA